MGSYFCGSVENAMSRIFLQIYILRMHEVDLVAHTLKTSLTQLLDQ